MKLILTCCLFFCVVGNCSAQLGQLVAVPVLKEDKKIDDLMTIILKQDKASGGFDQFLTGGGPSGANSPSNDRVLRLLIHDS